MSSTNDLGRRAFGSVLWAGAGRVGRAVAQIVFMVALGRAVGPGGFAAASIALIGYQLSSTIAVQSFAMALVRYSDPDDGRDATAFWFNILLTAVPVLVAVLFREPVARWLDLPELVWLLPLLTGMGLVAAPSVLAYAQLSRQMNFRRIAGVETLSSVIGAVTGVLATFLGTGLLALVIYAGVQRLVEVAMLMWRQSEAWPKGRPSRASMGELLRFTLPLAGMQTVTFANGSIDQFFVGQAGSPVVLGYYGLARRFSRQPTQMISFSINRAIYPALVRARETEEGMGPLFLRAVRISVLLASLPLFLLAVVASDFLVVAMGPEWEAAGAYLGLFALVSAVLPVGGVLTAALRAEGRTGMQLLFQSIRLAVSALLLSLFAALGVDIWWMAVTVALISLSALILPAWEVARHLPFDLSRIIRELVVGILPSCGMLVAVEGLKIFVFPSLEPLPRFLALSLAGVVIGGAIAVINMKRFRKILKARGKAK